MPDAQKERYTRKTATPIPAVSRDFAAGPEYSPRLLSFLEEFKLLNSDDGIRYSYDNVSIFLPACYANDGEDGMVMSFTGLSLEDIRNHASRLGNAVGTILEELEGIE